MFPNESDDFVRGSERCGGEDIGTLVVVPRDLRPAVPAVRQDESRTGHAGGSSNADSSRLVGVRRSSSCPARGASAAALGALRGVIVAGAQAQVTSTMMFTIFGLSLGGGDVGGLDSPIGAVVGGLSIGVVENIAAEYLPEWIGQEMKLSVALLTIFVVLLVKPSGLFGTEKVERVMHVLVKVHWGSAALGIGRIRAFVLVAAAIMWILHIPTQTQVSTQRHDDRLSHRPGDGAQPRHGLRRDRLPRALVLLLRSAPTRWRCSSTTMAGRRGGRCTPPPCSVRRLRRCRRCA